MIDKLAGYKTQVRVLEKKLKEMDSTKLDPAKVKQITDALKDLKELIKEKEDKREQRKKQKEEASKEVAKEADSGSITTTTTSPAAPQAPGAMTTPSATTTPATTPDDQKSQCALCGGLTFPDYPSYQQHMEFTHASDVMPTTPGQKEDKLVASVDPVVNKVETDPKLAPGVIVPDSVKRHNDIVDRVEKDPKIAPHIISEKEEGPKFKLDDVVKPVRGAESTGKVMRWDGKPSDLVYVAWDSGPLSERDTFGGYYPHDLELFQEEPVEAMAASMEKPACADCTSMKEKHSDLKNNYDALLKDLKEERDIHYEQGNSKWVARLDQKIRDLEKAIADKFGGEKTAGAQNAKELTLMDHTPPRANTSGDEIGRDTYDEFQDEWSEPARDAVSSKNPITQTTKISVFKKEFTATPITDQKKFGGYDISDATGKKILNIKSKDSQPMTKDQLEFCAQIELTRGLKQAKLVEKVAFLEAGSKVYIIASDRTGKRVKFASMEQGIRGWAPLSKFAFVNKEGEMRKHKDHIDNTFGHNGKEILVDCPNGSGNMVWLPMGELLPITPPPATPESLNDLESAQNYKPGTKARISGGSGIDSDKIVTIVDRSLVKTDGRGIPTNVAGAYKPVDWNSEVAFQYEDGSIGTMFKNRLMPVEQNLESAKECPDCHGTFEGAEGETCPTCGRFAVQKTALKPALPPLIPNQRMDVNASIEKQAHIRHEDGKWIVYNHDYTKQLGHYKTKAEAVHRLKSIEYWKNHKGSSTRPFSKKAEVLSNPYQSLTDHITDMKSRMSQVQDKMQTVPAIKTAGEDEKDNSKMDVPSIFADIAQGIDLLETKLKDKEDSEEIHKNLEELENMLWKIEMESGIVPNLPEHEKEEPEHKEIEKEIEDKKKVNKSAVDVQVTDETLEEGTGILPAITTPTAAAPTIQNVQPTDDDNLEVPVAKPTSPPAPGQIWVYNPIDKVYVSMPDPTNPGKQI